MLEGHPTKNGTGIEIFGDYGDLKSLHYTIHEISNSLTKGDINIQQQAQLLMNFSYEIRKAYSGHRLKDKLTYIGEEIEIDYYGFKYLWTDLLIVISILRHNAGYTQTDKLHQANLYLLEYITEKALFNYDPQGAQMIQNFIGQRINITNKYISIVSQAINIKFLTTTSGKRRFRKIPQLIIDHFSELSPAYKKLIVSFEISAQEKNCEITGLEFNEFPEIKW